MAITDTITIRVIADTTQSSPGMRRTEQELGRIRQAAQATQKAMVLLGRAVAVFAAVETVKRFSQMATELGVLADRADAMGRAFNRAFGASGRSGPAAFLEEIQQAARGTLSEIDALTIANQALATGTDALIDQLPKVVSQVRSLSVALGRNGTEDIERFIKGVNKLEQELLDELGIVARAETAFKAYAATLGISSNELNAQQRQTAFALQAIEQLEQRVERLGPVVNESADRVAALGAAWTDLKTALGGLFGGQITQAIINLTQRVNEWSDAAQALGEFFESDIEKLQRLGGDQGLIDQLRNTEAAKDAMQELAAATERVVDLQGRYRPAVNARGEPREQQTSRFLEQEELNRRILASANDIEAVEDRIVELRQQQIQELIKQAQGEDNLLTQVERRLDVAERLRDALRDQADAQERLKNALPANEFGNADLSQLSAAARGLPGGAPFVPPPERPTTPLQAPQTSLDAIDQLMESLDTDLDVDLDAIDQYARLLDELDRVMLQSIGNVSDRERAELALTQAQRRRQLVAAGVLKSTRDSIPVLTQLESAENDLQQGREEARETAEKQRRIIDRLNDSIQAESDSQERLTRLYRESQQAIAQLLPVLGQLAPEFQQFGQAILQFASGNIVGGVASSLNLVIGALSDSGNAHDEYREALRRTAEDINSIVERFTPDDPLTLARLNDELEKLLTAPNRFIRTDRGRPVERPEFTEAISEILRQIEAFGRIDVSRVSGAIREFERLSDLELLKPEDARRGLESIFNEAFRQLGSLDLATGVFTVLEGYANLTADEVIRLEEFITRTRIDALQQQQDDISNAIQDGLSDADRRAIRAQFDVEEIALRTRAQAQFAGAGSADRSLIFRNLFDEVENLRRTEEATVRDREAQLRLGVDPVSLQENIESSARQAVQDLEGSVDISFGDIFNLLPGLKLRLQDIFDFDDLPEIMANIMAESEERSSGRGPTARRGR